MNGLENFFPEFVRLPADEDGLKFLIKPFILPLAPNRVVYIVEARVARRNPSTTIEREVFKRK